MIKTRRFCIPVPIGGLTIGGGMPVVVQSMTDTDTENASKTANQILELAAAGSEMVRITVNTEAAARQVPFIRDLVRMKRCIVPLIGDFHYNGHFLLTQYPACAEALDKYRVNPGNVGFGQKRETQFATIVEIALRYEKPIRIGANWGSTDSETMVQSVLDAANMAERLGMGRDKIVLSCKASRVQDLITVYTELAHQTNYALHLGLTEAGMGTKGIVASSIAIGLLLQQGIGDTIRVSLTPRPGALRTEEVTVSQHILQTLGLRAFTPAVTSCPGCGRTTSSFFRVLADEIEGYIQKNMPVWKQQYPGVEAMKVAVMGCVVNGPGESKHADIGISLPGSGEEPAAPVFLEGRKITTLRGPNIAEAFKKIVNEYVAQKFTSF